MGRLKPSSSHSHRLSKTMCAAAAPFCQQPAAMRVGRHIHQLAHRPLQPLVVLQPLRQPTARLCLSARAVKAGTQPLEYTTLAEPTRTEVEVRVHAEDARPRCAVWRQPETSATTLLASAQVKKSRFVVTSWPVTSGSQAASLIKQHSDPGASHNCYGTSTEPWPKALHLPQRTCLHVYLYRCVCVSMRIYVCVCLSSQVTVYQGSSGVVTMASRQ